jgi:hypothetical protein
MKTRSGLSSILMAGGVVLALVGAALAMVGSTSAAPDLLVNGHFDTDTSNWTAQSDTTMTHVPTEDANLRPTSGAVSISDDGLVVNDAIITSDCIVLTGDASYDVVAWYKEAAGSGSAMRGQVIVTLFDDVACSTNAAAHPSGQLDPAAGWLEFTGSVVVSGELSAIVELTNEGATDVDDIIYWDKVSLSNGTLDTPTALPTDTPTNTPVPATATNTPVPTDTPAATNTPAPTNTAAPTNTPAATNTPAGTDTPEPTETPTETPVPADTATMTPPATHTSVPTSTSTPLAPPPAAAIDQPANSGGAGAGGEQPEGAAADGEELPEDAENLADLGYGPQADESHAGTADVIATLAFGAALALISAGAWLRRQGIERAK